MVFANVWQKLMNQATNKLPWRIDASNQLGYNLKINEEVRKDTR